MTGMMKNNLGMMVPQMLTMAWVNFFFSGFVVAKVPFPLTQKFRGMLQRGVRARRRPRLAPPAHPPPGHPARAARRAEHAPLLLSSVSPQVDLQSLDVTYVSSLSWYFLNVFGADASPPLPGPSTDPERTPQRTPQRCADCRAPPPGGNPRRAPRAAVRGARGGDGGRHGDHAAADADGNGHEPGLQGARTDISADNRCILGHTRGPISASTPDGLAPLPIAWLCVARHRRRRRPWSTRGTTGHCLRWRRPRWRSSRRRPPRREQQGWRCCWTVVVTLALLLRTWTNRWLGAWWWRR